MIGMWGRIRTCRVYPQHERAVARGELREVRVLAAAMNAQVDGSEGPPRE